MKLSVLLLLAVLPAAAQKNPDWNALKAETLEHFSALLKIDTSNPPGNETRAAEYLKQVLEREGIPARLIALDRNRANLVARIRGTGSNRPLLIMGHTDVVGVQREKWTVDPFAAARKDGYIYGRGAVDDKDNVVACLMTMLLLKRMNVQLSRDVIFLAEAGEEATTTIGIQHMVDNFFQEIDAEYALAEGGGGSRQNGKVRFVGVSTSEKVPRRVRLIARGTAGHGSVPRNDNALIRLSNAVAKISAWKPPMRLNDTTRAYFERLATISTPEEAARYNHIANPEKSDAIERYFADNEMSHYSMLRTSIVPTILKAGFRSNVIPSEAEATLDIRAVPDEDITRFYGQMKAVINDPNIEIAPLASNTRPISAPSRLDSEMFRALERVQKRMYPSAITLPNMMTGATDMSFLRAKGIQAYGVGPIVDEKDRYRNGAHSDDERIEEGALHGFVEFFWNAVTEIGK